MLNCGRAGARAIGLHPRLFVSLAVCRERCRLVPAMMSPLKTNQRFRKNERLGKREDFARVYAAKCSAGDDLLVVYAASNQLPYTRIGISVSRKTGIAVRRSYIRRRIREAFRRNKEQIPKGVDLICIAKKPAGDKDINVTPSLIRLSAKAAKKCAHRQS